MLEISIVLPLANDFLALYMNIKALPVAQCCGI